MGLGRGYEGQDCSLARSLELIGERWTLLVVRDAFFGVRRFRDFVAHLDVPRAVLASRLHDLVQAGVLQKQPCGQGSAREEYVLTAMGRELWPAVYALSQWGERYLTTGGRRRVFRHAECGTGLDAAGNCPHCGRWIAVDEIEVLPGPGLNLQGRTDAVSLELRLPHRLLTPLQTRPELEQPEAE